MLLQALVVGRALIDSCHTQTQRKLEAVVSRSYTQYRDKGTVLRKRAGKRAPPVWQTVYDTRLAQQRLMGTSSRLLEKTPQSPYHRPASRFEPFEDHSSTSESARSQLEKITFPESDFVDTKWTPIYRFPQIGTLTALGRGKTVQTAVCTVVAVYSAYAYSIGAMDLDTMQALNAVAFFGTIVLFLVSNYSRRLVGVVSTSECGTWLRVGHTNFWGTRVNVICPVEDVVPWSETDPSPNRLLGTFARYSHPSSKSNLVIPTSSGRIIDEEKFVSVFGAESLNWVRGRMERGVKPGEEKKDQ